MTRVNSYRAEGGHSRGLIMYNPPVLHRFSVLACIVVLACAAIFSSPRAHAQTPTATDAAIRAPSLQYDLLWTALDRYKTIAATGGWDTLSPGAVLERGAIGRPVAALKRRLIVAGDLDPAAEAGDAFDDTLADAVLRFQERHGLTGDGRVGVRTLAQLNVPVERRIAQIAANLERWRRLPGWPPANRLEVNIAAAELTILEADTPVLRTRVIVGSRRFPTPLLDSKIQSVVFNPPWNVPARIARNEILPRLRRQPSYLRDSDIHIVGWPDDPYGERIDWRAFRSLPILQLQQRPGPKNALGRIKFDFPNDYSVYLHDTPGKAAFNLSERALSHGCVRVEFPEDVARYVLRAELLKTPDLIDNMLSGTETASVRVSVPLPVVFAYWTAYVALDGRLHFRNDVYRHDARLGDLPHLTGQAGSDAATPPGGCAAT